MSFCVTCRGVDAHDNDDGDDSVDPAMCSLGEDTSAVGNLHCHVAYVGTLGMLSVDVTVPGRQVCWRELLGSNCRAASEGHR